MKLKSLLAPVIRAVGRRETWEALALLVRPGRCSLLAVVFAVVVSLVLVGCAASGHLNSFPRIAKPLVGPGIFWLFVVGTITNSMVCGYTAFALGMLFVYGFLGTVADTAFRVVAICRAPKVVGGANNGE